MQRNKVRTNGNGSFLLNIVIRVDKQFSEAFSLFSSIEPDRSSEEFSDFNWELKSIKRGDDENVVDEVHRMIHSVVPFECWKILWDESTY